MNIQEILATLYDQRKCPAEAITVLTGVPNQAKQGGRPKKPSSPPFERHLLSAEEIRTARKKLRAQHKRMEKLAHPDGY